MKIDYCIHTSLVLFVLVVTPSTAVADAPKQAVQRFAGTGESVKRETAYSAGNPKGSATEIALGNPFGVEVIGDNVWLTTVNDHCVWQTTADGKDLRRVAGNGTIGYSGDGGAAVEASFNWPHEVRVDPAGNLFIADTRNHVIRRVDAKTRIVTTLAGSGTAGFAGEKSSGGEVQFDQPHSVVLDGAGGLLVADTKNHRIRRIDLQSKIVTTIAGTGERKLPTNGARALTAPLFGPRSLAVDEKSIWIALREGNSIWRLDRKNNTLHHVAGTGKKGYGGDGGPPLRATFSGPKGLVMDDQERLLVVDTENHAVRRIDLGKKVVETVLGGIRAGNTTTLKRPHGISFHPGLGFIVADSENHRVVRCQR